MAQLAAVADGALNAADARDGAAPAGGAAALGAGAARNGGAGNDQRAANGEDGRPVRQVMDGRRDADDDGEVNFRPRAEQLEMKLVALEEQLAEYAAAAEQALIDDAEQEEIDNAQRACDGLKRRINLMRGLILERAQRIIDGHAPLGGAGAAAAQAVAAAPPAAVDAANVVQLLIQQLQARPQGKPATKQTTIPSSLPEWHNGGKESVHEFLRLFENVLAAANVGQQQWPNMLRYACRNSASNDRWVDENLVKPGLAWAAAKAAFIARFRSCEQRIVWEQEFADIKQGDREALQVYGGRFETLVAQLGYADDNELLITKFRDSLRPAVRARVLKFLMEQENAARIAGNVQALANLALFQRSLKSYIEKAIELEAIVNTTKLDAHRSDSSSGDKGKGADPKKANHGQGGGGAGAGTHIDKNKCRLHPHASHTWGDCRANPKNRKPAGVQGAPIGGGNGHGKGGIKQEPNTVTCFSCKAAGHKANDPSCPNFKYRGAPAVGASAAGASASSSAARGGPAVSTRRADIRSGDSVDRSLPSEILSGEVAAYFKRLLVDAGAPDASIPATVAVPADAHVHTEAKSADGDGAAAKRSQAAANGAAAAGKTELRALVSVVLNGVTHTAGIDTYASHSMIDKTFVERNGIRFTPLTGVVELADANKQSARIGLTDPLTVTLHPPGVTLEHRFEVFPVRASTYPHDILIGRDLQEQIFRDGDKLVLPLRAIEQLGDASMNSRGARGVAQVAATDKPSAGVELQEECIEFVPEEGLPEKITLSTPESLRAEFDKGREHVMTLVREALEENFRITGFCTLPESVMALRLKPGAEAHLNQRQYPLAHKLVELGDKKFQKWKVTARVERAPAGCKYNNPVTIQPKKDDQGKWSGQEVRVCFDGRRLNLWLENDDSFQIPVIRDVLEALAGHRIYGQFDLEDAYLQFLLTPESRDYTAFMWMGEQWRFVGCIYGLKNLAGHLSRIMSRLFADLKFAMPYFDNVPFASDSWEEHAEHAYVIIKRLTAANLKIKPASVMLGHAVMKCLGHTVSAAGVGIDDDKMESVRTWERPETGAQMATFLGFVTFIGHHVRHFGELTASLHELKKHKQIAWTPAHIECFEAVKRALAHAPALAPPDFKRPFHVATDASNLGIGGVLYQPADADAAESAITPHNIVRIYSKKLAPFQQRYPAYKKELFAIVTCLRKFHAYLWGRTDIVLVTDHKPLTYILQQPALSPALQQWLDVILDYTFTVRHRAGVLHVQPDALSRMYTKAYSGTTWGVTTPAALLEAAGPVPQSFTDGYPPEPAASHTPSRASIGTNFTLGSRRAEYAGLLTLPLSDAAAQQPWWWWSSAATSSTPSGAGSSSSPSGTPLRHTSILAAQPTGGGAMQPAPAPVRTPTIGNRPTIGSRAATLWAIEHKYDDDVDQQGAPAASSAGAAAVSPDSKPPSDESKSGASVDPVHIASQRTVEDLIVAMEKRGLRTPAQAEERQLLVKDTHAIGHFGREAMFRKLYNDGWWWPSMRHDIEMELKQCDDCLKYTVAKRGWHPAAFVHAHVPWDHIMIDTATNLPESIDGMTVLLVVVDVCTGFVVLRALPNKSMETIARELWKIFSLLGLPRVVQSDNGTEFVNQVIEALVKICGIEHRTIAEYNPRADGKVERNVGTALTAIKKKLHGHKKLWSLFVDYAQLAINAKVASLTNTSPFALMFGRRLNEMRDYSQDPPIAVDVQAWTAHQEKIAAVILPAINEHVLSVKAKQSQRLDTIRRQLAPESFPAGSTVMLKNIYAKDKFDPAYIGPYTVERRARSGTYVLRDALGDILDRRVPPDQIKLVSRTALPRDEEAPIFEVERIVAHRGDPGNREYLTAWKGYAEQTWEPEAHFNSPATVKAYWDRVASHTAAQHDGDDQRGRRAPRTRNARR